ncbi:MAG: tetratricopeptide repeat protein, partial [Anaerolineae bacterium]|nr:tetratricopeptide repeat protein [Anaerolineae bacterium]
MPFAQRRPLPQPEPGQSVFAGREKEIGLYRLHFHRPKDHPQVRLITAVSGPGGVGKSRLLDELEWYRPDQTIYSRIDGSAMFGHDAVSLLWTIADGLHRAGEPVATPRFDRLFEQRRSLRETALARTTDVRQLLRHFERPVLLGLDPTLAPFSPNLDQFAGLRWSADELALAFETPITLLTEALVMDLNQGVRGRGYEVSENSQDGLNPNSAEVSSDLAEPVDRIVLIFDDFDRLHPAACEWLLTILLGHLRDAIDCDLRLVLAGREPLPGDDEAWTAWVDLLLPLPLEPFTPAEVIDFMQKNTHLTDPAAIAQVSQATGRLPLWLSVWLTSGADSAPQGEGVDLLAGLTETQRGWLTRAALLGSFDQPRLAQLLGPEAGRTAFYWLISRQALIKVNELLEQFELHPTLAEALLEIDQNEAVDRRNLLDYLDDELARLQADLQPESATPTPASQPRPISREILPPVNLSGSLAPTPTPTSTPTPTAAPTASIKYRAAALERLHHTLASDETPSAPFLPTISLTALTHQPALLLDLLTHLKELGYTHSDNHSPFSILHSPFSAWLSGHWADLRPILTELLSGDPLPDPTQAMAHSWLGYSYLVDNEAGQAIEHFSQALQFDDNASLYIERGLAYLAQDDFAGAIADLSQAIERRPDNAALYHLRGQAYSYLPNADPLRAVDDFDQAIRLDADNPALLIDRGQAFTRQGDHDRAIEDYAKAILLKPDEAAPYFYRGLAYADLQELAQATRDFSRAIELQPDNVEAYFRRGLAYAAQDQLDQAIDDFSRTIERDPRHAAAYQQRGLAYHRQNNPDQAVADFDQAIRLDPTDRLSLYNLGLALLERRDPVRAIRYFDRALDGID